MSHKNKAPGKLLITSLQKRDERLSQKAENSVDIARRRGSGSGPQVLVGVSQHPYTKCWQIWLSLYGQDICVLTAHRQSIHANVMLRAILTRLTDPVTLAQPDPLSFLDSLRGDAIPMPFPPTTLAQICASIGRGEGQGESKVIYKEEVAV
jgi:hypothetical protein